jgi:cystathionine beta-lyase
VDATVAAWDEGQPWLDGILAQLRANRDWLAQALAAELPGVVMRVPEATYLAWLDCRTLALPCSAGQFFLDKARVGLNFGETFGPDYAGFARLNFATSPEILWEIVGRMGEAVRNR